MMLRKKTKENPVKGCVISLIAVIGLLLACFLFCTVVFQLNQATIAPSSSVFGIFLG